MSDGLEATIGRIKAEAGGINSVLYETRLEQWASPEFFPVDARNPGTDWIESRYVETAAGRRLFEERSHLTDGRIIRELNCCDGEKCVRILFQRDDESRQQQVQISRTFKNEGRGGFSSRSQPLVYRFVGKQPLHEAMPKAEAAGETKILGRPCDTYLLRDASEKTPRTVYAFHLDRETSSPLGLDLYNGREAYAASRPFSTWRAVVVEKIDGHLIPVDSESKLFEVRMPEKLGSLKLRQTIHVKRVEFNKDYPEALFRPKIEGEASVFDALEKTHRLAASPAPRAKAKPVQAGSTVTPIRAGTDPDQSTIPARATMGLDAAAIAAAAVLWWRRR